MDVASTTSNLMGITGSNKGGTISTSAEILQSPNSETSYYVFEY